MKKAIAVCSLAVLIAACGQKQETATAAVPAGTTASPAAAPTAQLPPGHPAVTGTAAPTSAPTAAASAMPPSRPRSQGTVSGTVAETLDAAGYTYVRVATKSGSDWAAVPQTTLKKGAPVVVNVQMVMENFESKTLKRKFDRIIFGNIEGPGGAPAAAMASAMPSPSGAGPMANAAAQHITGGAANVGDVKVDRAPGGKTVAEVWSARNDLKDKPVVIRGKVVKFLGGIMGKNWLHLRDGSGSADKGDNDIAITTNEVVAAGDVVTIEGKLSVDKDFGAGYRYPVIVEDAKVKK